MAPAPNCTRSYLSYSKVVVVETGAQEQMACRGLIAGVLTCTKRLCSVKMNGRKGICLGVNAEGQCIVKLRSGRRLTLSHDTLDVVAIGDRENGTEGLEFYTPGVISQAMRPFRSQCPSSSIRGSHRLGPADPLHNGSAIRSWCC